MKKIAIHQSQYLPWPPYFKKIAMADVFVIMDNVQYQRGGLQNRNKLRNKSGDFWMTIPVSGDYSDPISQMNIAEEDWNEKHWKSITRSYAKAPFWIEYEKELEHLYQKKYTKLIEINDAVFYFFIEHLGIDTKIVYLSQLHVDGEKSDLILNICRHFEADQYISGFGSKNYLDEQAFAKNNIEIKYEESVPPNYRQFHGEFISGLSTLDMILNVSNDEIQNYFNK
ncbi:WbqC family protein [Brevibacillus invocatus]|uniref:WbqC family protein n=1 Tax=Brevibacillus invocatus TaxID=173959 RepID=UPI0020403FB4|nr:WbqC family protein [Brevibacillus invocatus]MCM3079664.1 WbqC family protein [Brevibacillus invocatus]MCM3431126.1 WbqC family protein [Brevibacillus invocatus]